MCRLKVVVIKQMVKVIVLGAGGYIGGSVALSLRRAGHCVIGVIRKEEQRSVLEQNEIIVFLTDSIDDVVGTLDSGVAAVIDTRGLKDFESLLKLATSVTSSGAHFVFTSGCLDYGDHPGTVIEETTACPEGERPQFCAKLIDLNATVLRPGFVYGGSFGKFASAWFKTGEGGRVVVDGNGERYFPYVHVTDVGEAFRAVVEQPSVTKGQIYDLADTTRLNYRDTRMLFASTAGIDVSESNVTLNAPATWGNISCLSKGTKIVEQLGFRYKRGPLQDEIALGFKSYQQNQK